MLLCLLTLRGFIVTQPQRDVRRLHRLPHHPYEVDLAMISQFRRECHTPFRKPLQFIVMSVMVVINGTFPHTYRVSL